MQPLAAGFFGALGSIAVFAFLSFCVWIDYRKKKDDRDASHQARMKALELGYPPLDAEVARVKAYASAVWAAGLIGLLVPMVLLSFTFAGTVVAMLSRHPGEDITVPLIVAWSITVVTVLVIIVRSLRAILQVPRPTRDVAPGPAALDKRASVISTEIHKKSLEL